MAGEFEVILELIDNFKEADQAKIAKAQVIHTNMNFNFIYKKAFDRMTANQI